ncbi:hypothetical protein [Nostoc sp.]|uniref:hypothetical protein n=1 Tax=Nostoc sp. TaxID=1180 RepID=UPI002FFC850C
MGDNLTAYWFTVVYGKPLTNNFPLPNHFKAGVEWGVVKWYQPMRKSPWIKINSSV